MGYSPLGHKELDMTSYRFPGKHVQTQILRHSNTSVVEPEILHV